MTIYIVDAFTDQLFKGNPAGVCVLNEWLPDELMQQAEMALYRAKAMGRGRFCFFEKGNLPRA